MSKTYRTNPATRQKELESNQIKNKKEKGNKMTPDLVEFIRDYEALLEEKREDLRNWIEYESD